eukprot:TRINITY_DN2015_c0_g2_i3.p1 TRINITY_DN2015_c0_g2~~TRINITY_DN2015_c0_g2_i3.p1  ORF type:complete len:1386 (-),score=111.70 TRINITY_DN2015_c0_g2_i3:12207-15953(-)
MKNKEAVINGFLMVGLNYDSNVYADTGETQFGVPLFNINVTGNKEKEDYYNSNVIGVNHIKDIGEVGSWVWKSTGLLLNNNYRRYTDKNLFGLGITTGPSYFGKDYELYFPFSATKIWQGGKQYVNDISQGARWTRKVDQTFIFSAGYKYSRVFYENPNTDKDYMQHAFTLSATKFFTKKWNIALGAKLANSKGTRLKVATEGNTGNSETEGSINTTYQATDKLSFTAGALFRNQNYNEIDVFFGNTREDRYQSYSLSSLYSITDSSSIKASVADIQNHSNHGPYDYDKTTAGINYIMTFQGVAMKSVKNLLLIALLFAPLALHASIAKFSALSGDVSIIESGKSSPATMSSVIDKKDKIVTGESGKAQIVFKDNTVITLGINSDFAIEEYFSDAKKPKASFSIGKGTFKALTGAMGKINPDGFKLKTKTATIGIRGTGILGQVTPTENNLACTQGAITVTSVTTGDTVEVPAGSITTVTPNTPPTPPRAYTPEETGAIESESGVNEMPSDTQTQEESGGVEGGEAGATTAPTETATNEEGEDTQVADDEGAIAGGDETTPEATDIEVADSLAVGGVEATDQTDNFLDLTANELGESVEVLINRVNEGDYEISGDLSSSIDTSSLPSDVFDVDNSNRDVIYDGMIGFMMYDDSGPGEGYMGTSSMWDGFHILGYSLTGDGEITYIVNTFGNEVVADPINVDISITLPTLNSSSNYVGGAKVYDDGSTSIYADSKQEFIFWQNFSTTEMNGYTYTMQKYAFIGDGIEASVIDTDNENGIVMYEAINGGGDIGLNMRNNNVLWVNKDSSGMRVIVGTRSDDEIDNTFLAGLYASGYDVQSVTAGLGAGVGQTELFANIYGSEYQGLGMIAREHDNAGTSFIDKGTAAFRSYNQVSPTPTGSFSYIGYGSKIEYADSTYSVSHDPISVDLTINRDNGNIDAIVGGTTHNGIGGITSAYINDDYFAYIIQDEHDTYLLTTEHSQNSGSDYLTWGYWGEVDDTDGIEGVLPANSYWIAGEVASDIDTQISGLISDSAVYNYQGITMGYIKNGVNITSATGAINLTMNFSNTQVTGSLTLGDLSGSFDSGVNNLLSNGSYTGPITVSGGSGTLSGQLYGPNLEQTGGAFRMDDGTIFGSGIFKADKQPDPFQSSPPFICSKRVVAQQPFGRQKLNSPHASLCLQLNSSSSAQTQAYLLVPFSFIASSIYSFSISQAFSLLNSLFFPHKSPVGAISLALNLEASSKTSSSLKSLP